MDETNVTDVADAQSERDDEATKQLKKLGEFLQVCHGKDKNP